MNPRTSPPLPLRRPSRRTLFACAALAVLNLALAASAPACAQAAPAGAAVETPAPQGVNADPPGRVARLDYMAGDVTTEPAGATDWSYAQLNRPLTTGDQLWNDANARSELHIGSSAVRLGPQTSLDVLNLDDSNAQLKVAQGVLSMRVRELPAGTAYEIDTPNLALGVNGPGDYRVDVAPDGSATTVTVRSGSVTVYGENGQMPMSAGQQIRFAGTGLQQTASDAATPPDAFDQWALARDAAEDRSVSARYVSRDMPGYQDLDANGNWRADPQYGEVWMPNAQPAGWAPYHDGHWVWQAPWGWTWVDDAPWGFAPYHYGRWARLDDGWAWVPGPLVASAPPVYAPALVAFVGDGGGGVDWNVSLTAGAGIAAGVAWFALGPGEAWHPREADWSPRYYERVNRPVVVNNVRVTNITHVDVHNTYVNYRVPGAVTAVPAAAFVHGQPVARFAQRVDPQQWRGARIEPGTPGIAPVATSFGNNLRRADYRPPAALAQRQVVATRAPVAPPAFHDTLAQRFVHAGGMVPGAGTPVVRAATPVPVPASFAAPHGAWGQQNVRVVPPHSPVVGEADRRAVGAAPQRGQPDTPPAPANARTPAMQAMQEHGVPRPPQVAGRPDGIPPAGQPGRAPNGTAQAEAHQPMWTQPHAPMATRGQLGNEAAREPQYAMQQPREAAHGQPQPEPREAPRAPQDAPQRGVEPQTLARQEAPQPARPDYRPQPQEQQRTQPQREAPRPQQAEPAREPAQPRAEYRPPQPQQQPRLEPRPQPQPQPHGDFHPPQPQPHPEPHAEPRPAPHPDEHANHGHDDQKHG